MSCSLKKHLDIVLRGVAAGWMRTCCACPKPRPPRFLIMSGWCSTLFSYLTDSLQRRNEVWAHPCIIALTRMRLKSRLYLTLVVTAVQCGALPHHSSRLLSSILSSNCCPCGVLYALSMPCWGSFGFVSFHPLLTNMLVGGLAIPSCP